MAAFDRLPVQPGFRPMEAKLVDALPEEQGWQYEPKWDGFRCLVFRDGDDVELQSKALKSLARYFPDVVQAVRALPVSQFVVDGELIISVGGILSFEALQLRLHPTENRVRKLAADTPAQLMLFDILADEKGADQSKLPLDRRRAALERFFLASSSPSLLLSPATTEVETARSWLEQAGGALDGVIAKRSDGSYVPGERVMLKMKQLRTADCVVGGFRYGTGSREVASLLLGLYNSEGHLDHVGFTSSIPSAEKPALTKRLEALIEPPGFTGKAPGGPSRWSTGRSGEWQPLRTELIAEVRYDHVTGNRFRHGTRFLRWRPDKAPEQCQMDQLLHEAQPAELASAIGETE